MSCLVYPAYIGKKILKAQLSFHRTAWDQCKQGQQTQAILPVIWMYCVQLARKTLGSPASGVNGALKEEKYGMGLIPAALNIHPFFLMSFYFFISHN